MPKRAAQRRKRTGSPSKSVNETKRNWAYFLLIINVFAWGSALPIVKPGLAFTTPFRFLFYRYTLATLFSLPFFIYGLRRYKIPGKQWLTITALEFIGLVLALTLLYEGLARTTSLEAALIAITTPLFTVLGGICYLREKEERHEWVGFLLAFAGTILITITPFLHGDRLATFSFTGNLLIIAQNVVSAMYYVLAKKYYQGIPKLYLASFSFQIGAVAFALLSFWQLGGSLPGFISTIQADLTHFSVWFSAVYMALFASIIGYTAYLEAQEYIEASEASLFFYLHPLVFIPLSYFLLGETITSWQVVAIGLILFGVVIAEKRWRRQ